MTKEDLTRLSRKMAFLLRHDPESAGLTMESDGSVKMSDLAAALKTPVSTILEIVESDAKKRYVISGQRIWAAQGHSIPVTVPLEKLEECGTLFHGTKQQNLDSIFKTGLRPGDRQWVHLSVDSDTASVVAARRNGTSVILKVDGAEMVKNGLELFRSSNGVILAREVPIEYISTDIEW